MRIADFKSALKIAPAKTDGNFIVKRAAVFYWLIGIVIAAIAIAIAFHFDEAVRDFMAQHQSPMTRNFMRNVSFFGDWPSHLALGLLLLGTRLAAPQQEMDAHFFVDAAGDGDRWDCRHRHQTHDSKGPPICEIGAALGRSAFQHEISRVSLRSRSGLDRIFWCLDLRAPPCRPRVSSNPDSDRVLPNVPWRALPVRCCVRSGTGNSMCCPDLAFFRARTE